MHVRSPGEYTENLSSRQEAAVMTAPADWEARHFPAPLCLAPDELPLRAPPSAAAPLPSPPCGPSVVPRHAMLHFRLTPRPPVAAPGALKRTWGKRRRADEWDHGYARGRQNGA